MQGIDFVLLSVMGLVTIGLYKLLRGLQQPETRQREPYRKLLDIDETEVMFGVEGMVALPQDTCTFCQQRMHSTAGETTALFDVITHQLYCSRGCVARGRLKTISGWTVRTVQ